MELNLSINVLTDFVFFSETEIIKRSIEETKETPERTTKLILIGSVATLIASITLDALWQT